MANTSLEEFPSDAVLQGICSFPECISLQVVPFGTGIGIYLKRAARGYDLKQALASVPADYFANNYQQLFDSLGFDYEISAVSAFTVDHFLMSSDAVVVTMVLSNISLTNIDNDEIFNCLNTAYLKYVTVQLLSLNDNADGGVTVTFKAIFPESGFEHDTETLNFRINKALRLLNYPEMDTEVTSGSSVSLFAASANGVVFPITLDGVGFSESQQTEVVNVVAFNLPSALMVSLAAVVEGIDNTTQLFLKAVFLDGVNATTAVSTFSNETFISDLTSSGFEAPENIILNVSLLSDIDNSLNTVTLPIQVTTDVPLSAFELESLRNSVASLFRSAIFVNLSESKFASAYNQSVVTFQLSFLQGVDAEQEIDAVDQSAIASRLQESGFDMTELSCGCVMGYAPDASSVCTICPAMYYSTDGCECLPCGQTYTSEEGAFQCGRSSSPSSVSSSSSSSSDSRCVN